FKYFLYFATTSFPTKTAPIKNRISPFTSLSTQVKTIVIPGCIVIGEILFLIGAVFVGKEVVAKYKKYLNPKNWRRKGEREKYDK
ncbi:transporter suffix domain-containing protein, partial [Bacillus sp. SS-TM]